MAQESKQARRRRYNLAGASKVWVHRNPVSRKAIFKQLLARAAKRAGGRK